MNAFQKVFILGLIYLFNNVQSFTATTSTRPLRCNAILNAQQTSVDIHNTQRQTSSSCEDMNKIDFKEQHRTIKMNDINKLAKSFMVVLLSVNIILTSPVVTHAEEYEAPTLYTGESTEICYKRGILGKCLKTQTRTAETDNDKATQYFSKIVTGTSNTVRESAENDESDLMKRLRQQTEDNKEKNARIVKVKTEMNDVSASFGPFDRQVIILNTDGETFTVLANPQAMRLKEQGYIKNKKFVTQPSQEVLDANLNAPEGEGGFFGGLIKGVLSNGGI